MRKDDRRLLRDSRLHEYGARPLPDAERILVTAEDDYAASFSGQVALLVFLNLLGRCSRSISINLRPVPVVEPLPWAGHDLVDLALGKLYAADAEGQYEHGASDRAVCRVHFGRQGGALSVFGTGWGAWVGDTSAAPRVAERMNPFGPSLAAVMMATRLFVHRLRAPAVTTIVNAFDWSRDAGRNDGYAPAPELGELWVVGTGSVGSAVLYFLSLATKRFSTQLFDHDYVEEHNITRSPIFAESDIGKRKVEVTGAYLNECGIAYIPHPIALHETAEWAERQPGTPDLLVPTANEYHVRELIEGSLPPIQIYGTTGKNWQASVIRHIPLLDPCSLCVFPAEHFAQTDCATDASHASETKTNDASLPFLSFAAGLMAAMELVKLSAERDPSSGNRVHYFTRPEPRFVRVDLSRRPSCACAVANAGAQREMMKGSRYEYLVP